MATTEITEIDRKLYPELDRLLWDIHCQTIDSELAFRVYEERWGFVEAHNLSVAERALITRLTHTVGHGVFAPTFG